MKKILLALLSVALFYSCDDGDIIVTSFDFGDQSLQLCGDPGDYVFFKINNDAQESISLQLNADETLFLEDETTTFQIGSTTNQINYRIFNGDITADYYCNSIPPTSPDTMVEYNSTSGMAIFTKDFVFDDNDTLSEETEGGVETDTDEDGIPDFYDFDDDGDNVPTAIEVGVDPENPVDTDMDGTPDYLDPDDDGDGVLTRNEDLNMDLDPTNDVTDPNGRADYLNNEVAIETLVPMYREHSYDLQTSIQLFISDLTLEGEGEQITQESLDLGEINNIVDVSVTITPVFPDEN